MPLRAPEDSKYDESADAMQVLLDFFRLSLGTCKTSKRELYANHHNSPRRQQSLVLTGRLPAFATVSLGSVMLYLLAFSPFSA